MLTEKERKLLEAALAQLPSEMRAVVEKLLREYDESNPMSQLLAMSLPGEKWRHIKGQSEFYQISTKGRVASLKNGKARILKLKQDKKGYLSVSLHKNGKTKGHRINRLVALAFIPNPYNLPVVHHRDDNPANNFVENLEWTTRKQNALYAVESGAIKTGENHKDAKLTEEQVRYIRENYTPRHPEFGLRSLARKFGVNNGTILAIIRGQSWKHVK